jgi:hypothetical protein
VGTGNRLLVALVTAAAGVLVPEVNHALGTHLASSDVVAIGTYVLGALVVVIDGLIEHAKVAKG